MRTYKFKAMSLNQSRGCKYNKDGLTITYLPQPHCRICGKFIKIKMESNFSKKRFLYNPRYLLCEEHKRAWRNKRNRLAMRDRRKNKIRR